MPISLAQIDFLLSGGSGNNNPNNSIGGVISNFPIIGSVNNLFLDVTSKEAEIGKTDFRCFYIKNSSQEDYLFNCNIFIYSQRESGSMVNIGIEKQNENQEIKIVGPAAISGSVTFKYGQLPITVSWGDSPSSFASNLVSELNAIGIAGVEISFSSTGLTNVFNLIFNDYRKHPTLELFSNNLIAVSKPIVTVLKTVEGKPINSTAPLLATETVIPNNVEFYESSSSLKIEIGTLKPGDFFPVWIRRFTAPGVDFLEKDYFIFKIQGDPII
jgi:hypothetical protein